MNWLDLELNQEDKFAIEVYRREANKISKEQLIECLVALTTQLKIKERVLSQLLKDEVRNESRS